MSQPANPPLESSPAAAPVPQRPVSLDAFRGAAMALMVLVNNSGNWSHTYGPLRHSAAGTISLQSWLFDHCFTPLASPYDAALVWALAFVVLMYAAAYALYRRKWFIRV